MKHAPKSIEKLEDIFDVTRFCDGGNYIFRGENMDYGRGIGGKVTSGLYRKYSEGEKPLTKHRSFSVLAVEKQIIQDARAHLQDGASDMKVLTELQHYGGKTNLIDFTKNLHIALFFACDGKLDDDGRLILMDVDTLNNTKINYDESKELIQTKNILALPAGKNPRAIFQNSVFVHPYKGYLEKGDYKSVIVKVELKSTLLAYLRKYHDIKTEAIYKDIYGFIQNQSSYTTADVEFYLGLSCSHAGDFKGGISHYNKAIKLNPQMLAAYTNRGINLAQLERFAEAIEDHTKAIELLPRRSLNYFLRGMTYKHAGNLDAAVVDYNKAIEIGPPLAYQHTGLGEIYLRLQKRGDAINEFNKALQIEPDNHDAHYGLGYTYAHLANYEEALTHLRIARDLSIQKKDLGKAKTLAAQIAEVENTLAENTRPNAKATKKAPRKAAKAKKRKK